MVGSPQRTNRPAEEDKAESRPPIDSGAKKQTKRFVLSYASKGKEKIKVQEAQPSLTVANSEKLLALDSKRKEGQFDVLQKDLEEESLVIQSSPMNESLSKNILDEFEVEHSLSIDDQPRERPAEPERCDNFIFDKHTMNRKQEEETQPVGRSPSPKQKILSARSGGARTLRGELSLRSVVEISTDQVAVEAVEEEDTTNTGNMERVLEELKAPENESQNIEELILELNRVAKQNNGIIPSALRSKMNAASRTVTITKHVSKSTADESSMQQEKKAVTIPQWLRNNVHSEEITQEYERLARAIDESLKEISAKRFMEFRGRSVPSATEKAVGTSLLHLFFPLDTSLAVKVDTSWTSQKTYFSNTGKVVRQCRRLRDAIDIGSLPDARLKEVRKALEDPLISKEEAEGLSQTTSVLLSFVRSVFDLACFVNKARQLGAQENVPWRRTQKSFVPDREEKVERRDRFDPAKKKQIDDAFEKSKNLSHAMRDEEAEVAATQQRVLELKRRKNEIKWREERRAKKAKQDKARQEEMSYMEYQQELREQFTTFMKEELRAEKREQLKENHVKSKEARLRKKAEEQERKMRLLEEFRQTLERAEWKKTLSQEKVREREQAHTEFLERLKEEKAYKQMKFTVEKRVEEEERLSNRKDKLKETKLKLQQEQEELERELALLAKLESPI